MNTGFLLLWGVTVICFWIAVVRPSIFTKVTKRTHTRKSLLIFFLALGTVLFIATSVTAAPDNSKPKPRPTTQQGPAKPQVTTKQVTQTKPIAFQSQTVDDSTLAKGQTTVKQVGKNGVETITYSVTYTNGVETSRKQLSDTTTTQPITNITANGTYVAPPVKATPATVTSPTPSVRVGAICKDGSSSDATGSGACSHHGGVDHWLYN